MKISECFFTCHVCANLLRNPYPNITFEEMFRKEAEGADVCIRRMNSQEGLTSLNIFAQLHYQCPLSSSKRENLGNEVDFSPEIRKFGI